MSGRNDMAGLRKELETQGLEVRETHISWVFLSPTAVWKVKKPVDFGFLDFSTLEKRRAACHAEVELNRRLATDVYRGVVPLSRDAEGRLVFGASEPVIDWAVHMRRLSDDRRADHLLTAGRLSDADLARVARRLAAFHAAARADETTAPFGARSVIEGNVRENFAQTRDAITRFISAREAAEIETRQLQFLEENAVLFERRVATGRVRDGHGDLRLDHVYLDADADGGADAEAVTIIDCIEFNDRFRYADVCADIAFLVMDLAWRGRGGLAERFLAEYVAAADDFELYPLVDFYESYRAFVRAKVATFLAADEGSPAAVRQRAEEDARRLFLLALAAERRSLLPPALVAVGGVIGVGKSTVAKEIGRLLACPVVDADHLRKRLAGVEPTTPLHHRAFAGAYTPQRSDEVYAEVFRRGEAVLGTGRPVVLDASFRSRAHRAKAAQLARRRGIPFHFVECRAPVEVCRERLEARARRRQVSDGRIEILDEFIARFEAVDETLDGEHHVLDTTQPLDQNLARLREAIPTWPAQPVP